jgi:predicted hydrocarbon binding protein
LLEAVRAIDTPDAELDTELVHELRNKRFGLSETVHAQIRRYSEAVRKQQRVPYNEVLALARLIGRRPDADLTFREAGRRLARAAVATLSGPSRKAAILLPSLVGRPIALHQLRKLSARFFDGRLQRHGSSIVLEVSSPVSADAAPRAAGCGLYEAALRESLQTLAGAEGLVEHVACRSRGDASCQWRTDWRKR